MASVLIRYPTSPTPWGRFLSPRFPNTAPTITASLGMQSDVAFFQFQASYYNLYLLFHNFCLFCVSIPDSSVSHLSHLQDCLLGSTSVSDICLSLLRFLYMSRLSRLLFGARVCLLVTSFHVLCNGLSSMASVILSSEYLSLVTFTAFL